MAVTLSVFLPILPLLTLQVFGSSLVVERESRSEIRATNKSVRAQPNYTETRRFAVVDDISQDDRLVKPPSSYSITGITPSAMQAITSTMHDTFPAKRQIPRSIAG